MFLKDDVIRKILKMGVSMRVPTILYATVVAILVTPAIIYHIFYPYNWANTSYTMFKLYFIID